MDRVNEVYYRKVFSKKEQDDLRERIHWICENVDGNEILDVGCSQGITSILLARDGCNVLGIDINKAAIEYALNERSKENQEVQERLTFLCIDLMSLDTTKKFDTIIMGEILEHVANPKRLIRRALELLNNDGKLIVTVPFGYLPDPDHKKTFYFSNFIELIRSIKLNIHSINIIGNRLAAVCSKNESIDVFTNEDLLFETERFLQEFMVKSINDYNHLKKAYEEKAKEYIEMSKKLNEFELLKSAIKQELSSINTINESLKKLNEDRTYVESILNVVTNNKYCLLDIKKCLDHLMKDQKESSLAQKQVSDIENKIKLGHKELLSKYNELLTQNSNLEMQVNMLKNTVRYRLGDTIVNSLKRPGIKTLKLPFSIFKLILEGARRDRARKDRSNNKTDKRTTQKRSVKLDTSKPEKEIKPRKQIFNQKIYHKMENLPDYKLTHINNPNIKVACIMDEFSYNCFKYECNLEQLHFKTWKQQIDKLEPDFLLVESAWNGVENSWQFMLVDIQNKPDCAIKRLVHYCKDKGIPTVFWNKEDPPNYERFIETARLFDYVFTTEENVIERYKNDLGHDNVYVLPFAAQPAIHNPINSWYSYKENVAFAGTWYGKRHIERQHDMNMLLRPALDYGLHIFDRHYYTKSDRYTFPDIYKDNIVGSLDYNQMVKAYKLYKVFLNVNSVKDSRTMFARRVYELLASGTNVISSPSVGISEQFNELVPVVNSEEDTDTYLRLILNSPAYSERLSVLGVREVYMKHLYRHRFAYLVQTIGISKKIKSEPIEGVTIITCTNRQEFIDNVFKNYENQMYVNKELIVILNNNNMDIEKWKERAKSYNNVRIFQCDEQMTLGECLNYGIEKSKYEYIAKFDDDDYYSPYYLIDYVHAFEYTDADVIGKGSIFCHIESENVLAIRSPNQENKFTNFVFGATLVFKKQVFNKIKFQKRNGGEDSQFLRDCEDNGYKIYSLHKYNYVCIRRSNKENHTWKMDDLEFLRGCGIVAYTNDYISHATV